jgi:hypothetical protein
MIEQIAKQGAPDICAGGKGAAIKLHRGR